MRISARTLFVGIAVVVAVSLPLLSFDFGITEDEQLHHQHGKSILRYFLGIDDDAARFPLDDGGRLIFEYGPEMRDLSGALNIYGGIFDLLCAAAQRWISPFGEFETRHLINSLFGVLLIVSTGLVARQVAGWRAGVVALSLIALSPRIIGHSMNNPVDLPFAALATFSLFFMLRFVHELPAPSWRSWVPLLVGLPLATDVRIAGLVLFCYLGLFALVGQWGADRRQLLRSLGITTLVCAVAYLLVSVAWPLAHANPLTTPIIAFRHLSRLETFNAYDLFEGGWINRWEIPWYFVPKWLLIGTPLFVPLGILLSPLVFTGRSARRWQAAMVAFAAVFPLAFVVLRDSNVYNDARHVLFAYPPLVVLCALAFDRLLGVGRHRALGAATAVVLALVLIEPLWFMVRNHPNQSVYFSPLIGGVNGAWKRYETDFWGNSVRQAVEWIHANTEPQPERRIRVRLWYGDQTKAAYYVTREPGYEHVVAPKEATDWDYQIVQMVQLKYNPEMLDDWPPLGVVHEVRADRTPLSAVMINRQNHDADEVLARIAAFAERFQSYENYFMLASACYGERRIPEAIEALRKAAAERPNPVVYNNICSLHNTLAQWDRARAACEQALALNPDFELARNNLEVAVQGVRSETGGGR